MKLKNSVKFHTVFEMFSCNLSIYDSGTLGQFTFSDLGIVKNHHNNKFLNFSKQKGEKKKQKTKKCGYKNGFECRKINLTCHFRVKFSLKYFALISSLIYENIFLPFNILLFLIRVSKSKQGSSNLSHVYWYITKINCVQLLLKSATGMFQISFLVPVIFHTTPFSNRWIIDTTGHDTGSSHRCEPLNTINK